MFQSPFGELKIGKSPPPSVRYRYLEVSVPFRGIKNRKDRHLKPNISTDSRCDFGKPNNLITNFQAEKSLTETNQTLKPFSFQGSDDLAEPPRFLT